MPHVEPLRAGDPAAVGPYRLAGRLGAGGRGVVYLGRTRTGALVAVKVLHEGLAAGDRLAAEVAAARAVEPSGVARVLDASTDGRPYLVSEYVDGPSLRQAGRLAGEELRHLAIATATALTAVHRAGIAHGALTPTNVLLAPDGPRLTDFALPRPPGPTPTRALGETPAHPATGQHAGTLAYAAPEQLAGQAVGVAADVFSWGAVLVFAATGAPPFGDDAPSAVIHRVLHEEPRLGDLPRALREVVAACLAKDPAARPGMRDVVLRLTVSTRRPTPPPATPDWERTPDRAWDAPTFHPAQPPTTAPAPQRQAGLDTLAHAAAQETEEWDAPHRTPAETGERRLPSHPHVSLTEAVRTQPPSTQHHTPSAPAASPHNGTIATSTGTFSPGGPAPDQYHPSTAGPTPTAPHHDSTGVGPSSFAAGQDIPPMATGAAFAAPDHNGSNGVRTGGPSAFEVGQDGPAAFAVGQDGPAAFAVGRGNGRATEAGGGGAPLRAPEAWDGHPAVPPSAVSVSGESGGASREGDGGRRRRVVTVVVAVLAGVVVVVLGGAILWLTPAAPTTAPSPEPSGESSGGASAVPSDGGGVESSMGRGTASTGGGGLALVYLRPEGVRDGGCWSGGEVTLRALVRRTGGATAFRYAWVIDGTTAARSSAVVPENGRRYLTAPQALRGSGGGTHDVSLRITAPVALQRTITVTMCES